MCGGIKVHVCARDTSNRSHCMKGVAEGIYTVLYAFGQIQVLMRYRTILKNWERVIHDFIKYLVFCFPYALVIIDMR